MTHRANTTDRSDWGTPGSLIRRMEAEGYALLIDAASSKENAKAPAYYDIEADGLSQPWARHLRTYDRNRKTKNGRPTVWLNPPYSDHSGGKRRAVMGDWMTKVVEETRLGARVAALLPGDSGTAWYQKAVPFASEIWLIKGRIIFEGAPGSASFSSHVVIWEPYGEIYVAPRVRLGPNWKEEVEI